jgi:chaperonin cofactor prefoldin
MSSSSSTSQSGNPGYMMASQVDAEVARYRSLQESIQQQRSDLQILTSQSTENELVLLELKLVQNDESSSSTVYKMVGPTLLKQDLEEAKETVQKRIEFIQVGNIYISARWIIDLRVHHTQAARRHSMIIVYIVHITPQGEQSKLEASILDKQKTADELAQKIGKMQSMLQQTTADAVNAIAAQHHAG